VSSDGPTAAMKADALLLQVRGCGTNFQHILLTYLLTDGQTDKQTDRIAMAKTR